MSASWRTARGVSPSPHVFSRGNVLRSTIVTSWPAWASQYPVAAPAGPPPTTRTSTPGRPPLPPSNGLAVQLDRDVGGGEATVFHGGVVRRVGRAVVEILLRGEVATAEPVALVADGGQDLDVGQLAPGVLAPGRHGARRALLAADVAPGAVRLAGIGLVPGVHERELVVDLVERLLDLAPGQLIADTAFALGAVAGRALALEDDLPLGEGPGELLGRRLQAAGVHVGPQWQQADDGHGPERDPPAALGGGDVGRVGPGGRRGRRGPGLTGRRRGGAGGGRGGGAGRHWRAAALRGGGGPGPLPPQARRRPTF